MKNMIDFAELMKKETAPVQVSDGTLCAWVDCCSCSRWAVWDVDQDSYWCTRWREHTVAQGCSFGEEDE